MLILFNSSFPRLIMSWERLIKSWERLIMSWERLIKSWERVIMSSEQLIKSWERLIKSSERVIMSSERLIKSSERLINSSERLIKSSERLINSSERLILCRRNDLLCCNANLSHSPTDRNWMPPSTLSLLLLNHCTPCYKHIRELRAHQLRCPNHSTGAPKGLGMDATPIPPQKKKKRKKERFTL